MDVWGHARTGGWAQGWGRPVVDGAWAEGMTARRQWRTRVSTPVILRFTAITSVAATGAYLSLFAGSSGLPPTTRMVVGVMAAVVVGLLTAVQIVLSLESRSKPESRRETVPSQLPRDLLDFTGRNEQVRALSRALVKASGNRSAVLVTTIAGQGGVGKTVLAVHVAHLVAHSFPSGQIYVNLRGPEAEALDPHDVLDSLLRELGVSADAIPQSLTDRSRLFRSILARRRMLVLLDNAQSEAQVQPLLPGVSTSVVLITSRARMAGLDGITALRLDVLTEQEALDLLRSIIGRRRADQELEAARRLVALASYLPLAIRILGARLAADPARRVEDVVEHLLAQQTLLSTLDDGQRAVRSTLEISFVALSESARRLFATLGAVTVKTFPEWMLAQLDTRAGNAALTGRSELMREEMIEFLGPDKVGQSRYGYHDLLREFSREKLAERTDHSEVAAAAVETVGRTYVVMARAADALIRSAAPRHDIFPVLTLPDPRQAPPVPLESAERARLWCETELASLLLLTDQLLAVGQRGDVTALASALIAFCEEWSHWREWETLAMVGRSAAASPAEQVFFLFQLGRVHHLLGDWTTAMSEFEQARDLAQENDIPSIRAACLCAIGKVHQLGEIEAALPFFEEARRIYAEVGDDHAWAYVTANIADIYHLQHAYDESLQEFGLSLPVFRRVGDDWWEANAGIWIGDVYRGQERYPAALRRLSDSLAVMTRLGDERRGAVAQVHLARAYADSGDGRRAMRALGTAMPILERVADRWWTAMAHIELGKALWLLHKPAEALSAWNAALPVVQERNNVTVLADLRERMGTAQAALSDHSQGKRGS
ncbi:tetratricopeptide repeat protein [Plantactinospora sp. CA-294935]|uniref:tetratricopeptide repeat protein n=1 Tax=Plantactinospora sp. CA-294935 TaxID=3240012 RepID=UPI003D8A9359